jgi:hypothetical protein
MVVAAFVDNLGFYTLLPQNLDLCHDHILVHLPMIRHYTNHYWIFGWVVQLCLASWGMVPHHDKIRASLALKHQSLERPIPLGHL